MTAIEQREALKTKILQAFAGAECPPEDQIALHECEECAELRAAFAGIRWDAMEDALVEAHENSLPLLSPEAFAYFLPAFMLYAVDHLTWRDSPSEYTVYAVGPDRPQNEDRADWYRERFKALTREQAEVVDEFLALVERDPDLGAHLGDVGARREQFRELWESRWSA